MGWLAYVLSLSAGVEEPSCGLEEGWWLHLAFGVVLSPCCQQDLESHDTTYNIGRCRDHTACEKCSIWLGCV